MIGDFFKIYYAPGRVLDRLVERVKGPASFIAKMMIGAMLTMAASMLAFFGVIILEFWFLVKGEIKFSFSIFFAPIYAAFIIPIIFWVLDTIFLLAGVGAVGGKVDLIGTMNIRAFSMAPYHSNYYTSSTQLKRYPYSAS